MKLPLEGGCLCGSVRYRITAAPLSADYCHCKHVPARGGRTGGSTADGRERGLGLDGARTRRLSLVVRGRASALPDLRHPARPARRA